MNQVLVSQDVVICLGHRLGAFKEHHRYRSCPAVRTQSKVMHQVLTNKSRLGNLLRTQIRGF
jgi:hypothetical protein